MPAPIHSIALSLIPLLLALLAATPAAAQAPTPPGTPPAAAPTPARGTVVSEVSRKCWYVFQAKNNDYWFGSDGEGVYRWSGDGTKIINYTTADGLSGNRIRGIQGDKHGNVYFTTLDGGICKFDGHAFTTLPIAETPADGGWRLHPDDLWFQWFKGMPSAPDTAGPYRYDGTNLYHLKLPKSDREAGAHANAPEFTWGPYDVYSIYRDTRGHIWIGTAYCGACRYDGRSFGWLYEDHLMYAPNGGSFGIRSFIEETEGSFWICNTRHRFLIQPHSVDGKVAYTRNDGIDEKMTIGPLYFQGAVKDARGDFWLSTYRGGIWRYDGKIMTNYPVKDDGEDTQVFCIFKDNAGGLWLGTPTAGPYRFTGEAFEKFKP